jgi:UDP-N-acetylmuramate--alanine ligase
MFKKIKIGVLMGGKSLENEVSFNSGRTICDHINPSLYEIIPIFETQDGKLYILPWYFIHRGKITDFLDRLDSEATKILIKDIKNIVDLLFLALHGSYAEDGVLQSLLKLYNIPYIGSSIFAYSASHNKYFHNNFLKSNNIKAIDSHIIYPHNLIEDEIEKILKKYTFPMIVKPNEEGSSLGVFLVHNQEELKKYIQEAQHINSLKTNSVLVQSKIEGSEFSCIAIEKDNEWIAFEPTEIVHKNNDYIYNYVDKYMPGSLIKKTPASFNSFVIEDIKKIVIQIARLIESSYILRVDGFVLNNNEIIILETNMFPGMAPSSFTFIQAAYNGFTHSTLINHLINEALIKYNLKNNNLDIDNNIIEKEKKMRIGILFGGDSNEREISLESGRNVYSKLSSSSYELLAIFMDEKKKLYHIPYYLLVKNHTEEIVEHLTEDMHIEWQQLPDLIDFAFLALHGGSGEDGTIQGIFESLGIPYNGSNQLTSSLCMNKYKTNSYLKGIGFSVPEYLFIEDIKKLNKEKLILDLKIKNLIFPLISKPHDDGCSVGVKLNNTIDELFNQIQLLKSIGKNSCLIEEVIEGMELTVGVIGNYDQVLVLPPTYTPKKNEILSLHEKFLPGDGTNITPAPLKKQDIEKIQEEIKKIYIALGCSGYARIDCFYKKDKQQLIFLECNTLPALTPATCLFHQVAEINIKPIDFLEKIIKLGIEIKKK